MTAGARVDGRGRRRAGRAASAGVLALLLLAAAAPAAAPAAAQDEAPPADACPTAPVPHIAVIADIAEFAYDHGLSMTELGSIKSTSPTTSGHDVSRMLGLTRQTFSLGGNTTQGRFVTRPDGGICVGYTDGAITLHLNTVIYLISELAPGSCLYGQVRNHEQRHAKVGRRLFTEFAARVETAIAELVAEAPYVPVAALGAAKQAAAARLQQVIEPLYRDFRSTYRKRQAIIDTSGEYARVREACPGEQERLVQD